MLAGQQAEQGLHSADGWWARYFIGLIYGITDVDRFTWDNFGAVFGVGRQYAMETNQVQSGTRD